MKTKIAAIVYFVILGMIVYAANQGTLSRSVSFYRKIPFGDDLGHFFLMGILSFFATIVSGQRRVCIARFRISPGPIVVFVIVLMEELSQMFIPTRTFSFSDLTADILGIVTFAWLGLKFMNPSSKGTTDGVSCGSVLQGTTTDEKMK